MESFFDKVFWGNTILSYFLVVGGILAAWIVIRIVKKVLLTWAKRFTEKTENQFDDLLISVIESFVIPYAYIFVNYEILLQLRLDARLEKILHGAMAFVTMFYGVRLANHVLQLMISGFMRRRGESEERVKQLSGMLVVMKAFIWIVGLLTLANNFGYNVTTLLASLGVGGIAIALASQAILGDLFSYLVIFFDKPFEIGDFVVMGEKSGIIEYIGVKTTRIRSLAGEQLVVSNTHLTSSIIHNYKRMERRRVLFAVGVTYQTTQDQLKMIPDMVKKRIESCEGVQFDRAHLRDFGDFSINFEVVYYLLSPDYVKYMDTQQSVLLGIFEAFTANGIEFAYPTQTLFVEGVNGTVEVPASKDR